MEEMKKEQELNKEEAQIDQDVLDEVLKDSYSYMLYQESIMAFLNWLGIDMKETYGIVKKISKKIYIKHPEQMEELKKITDEKQGKVQYPQRALCKAYHR